MKVILKNSSMVFQAMNESAFFTNAWNAFDQTKFDAFVAALGGKSGSIWGKIKLLYIPLFSTEEDGNIYLDVISKQIVGLQPATALDCWELTSDYTNSSIKGYKAKSVEETLITSINVSSYGLTTDNICVFGLSTHNPNPGSSLTDFNLKFSDNSTLNFKNQNAAFSIVKNIPGGTPSYESWLSLSKTTSGYGTVQGYCWSNNNGVLGLRLTTGEGKENTEKAVTPALSVSNFDPAGRTTSVTNIYGQMLSLQGLASGLTYVEAQTVCTALSVFLT